MQENPVKSGPPPVPSEETQSLLDAFEPDGKPMEHLGLGLMFETLLKRPGNLFVEFKGPRMASVSVRLFFLAIVCYLASGLLVGSFSGGMQWWATPVKMTGGVLFSAVICWPSLYIFGCLARSEASVRQCLALLSGVLALSGVLLIGFLPVAWVFSAATESIGLMGFLHLGFWGISTLFGIRLLRAGMKTFAAESLVPIRVWALIFVLVCLQMSATLRPLLGSGDHFFTYGKQFFLSYWFTGWN